MADNNVSWLILDALRKEGIDHIFLVPGTTIDPFMPNYSRAGVRAIITSHEAGAAFMADGYGRVRGHFGVCMGIGGPGVTNMVTALSSAYSDRSRVLIVSGTIPTDGEGQGTFQDSSPTGVDDLQVVRPMTVFARRIGSAETAAPYLQKAIAAMASVETGPAFLTIPVDVQRRPAPAPYSPTNLPTMRVIDMVGARCVLDALAQSHRIAILAGNGCMRSQAGQTLQEFAARFRIPVVTTLRAKGAISEAHPFSFGVFGVGGSLQANKIILGSSAPPIPKAEVLLVLGATLNQNNTRGTTEFQPEKALIRVDINPNHPVGREYEQLRITADVQEFLLWLQGEDGVAQALDASSPAREMWLGEIRKTSYYDDAEARGSSEVPIHPARLIAELRRAAPRDTIIVADSGANTFFSGHHWTSYQPNECIILTTSGPMGYAVAAGIGAKLARPNQPCVAVIGDGGMLMHGMEIQTAVRFGVPLVVVVVNNAALGNVYLKALQGWPEDKHLAEIPQYDWAAFARTFGAEGVVVERPEDLADAFARAFASRVPFVIDARCNRECATPNP